MGRNDAALPSPAGEGVGEADGWGAANGNTYYVLRLCPSARPSFPLGARKPGRRCFLLASGTFSPQSGAKVFLWRFAVRRCEHNKNEKSVFGGFLIFRLRYRHPLPSRPHPSIALLRRRLTPSPGGGCRTRSLRTNCICRSTARTVRGKRTADGRPYDVNRNNFYDLRLFHLRALPEDFTKRGAFYFTRPQAEFRSRKARISLPSADRREGLGRGIIVNIC